MEMPMGDVADRFTIVLQKFIHGRKLGEVPEIQAELIALWSELGVGKTLAALLVDLLAQNVRIWGLEADIRNGGESFMSYAEIGARALAIRDINKERIAAKNAVAKHFGDSHIEVKLDHASG